VSTSWNRPQLWLGLIAGGIGLLVTALAGLHVFMTTTATKLHPDPAAVPSTTGVAPAPEWAAATALGRRAVREAISGKNLPGLSVAVGVGGRLVWAEGFGWADLERREPMTPRTQLRIGTASIVLTSAAAGLLLERDTLKLDEPIQTYVPQFPKKPWPVTVRHLMGHLAGLGNDGGDESSLFGQHCERPVDAFPSFADDDLLFEPGTRSRFSRYDWIVISAAIEAAADEPFLDVMRTQVFEPLGMDDTRPDSATDKIPHRAAPYFPRYSADPIYGLDPTRDLDLSCYAGGIAFLSTPSDLVRFGLAINGGAFLKPATVQLLQTSQRLSSGADTGYGLGWNLETIPLHGAQVAMAGHDGDVLGGQVASLLTVRDRGLVVAVVSNTSYADTFAVASTLAAAFAAPSVAPSAATSAATPAGK
jgi:serine beta-lactamase-like protein LACTB, mitochondrial